MSETGAESRTAAVEIDIDSFPGLLFCGQTIGQFLNYKDFESNLVIVAFSFPTCLRVSPPEINSKTWHSKFLLSNFANDGDIVGEEMTNVNPIDTNVNFNNSPKMTYDELMWLSKGKGKKIIVIICKNRCLLF